MTTIEQMSVSWQLFNEYSLALDNTTYFSINTLPKIGNNYLKQFPKIDFNAQEIKAQSAKKVVASIELGKETVTKLGCTRLSL